MTDDHVAALPLSPVGVSSLLLHEHAQVRTQASSRIPGRFISQGRADNAIVAFLNHVFIEAAKEHVSDVHFSSQGDAVRVRYRQFGRLADRYSLREQHMETLLRKIAAKSDMLVAEVDRRPLDGSFRFDAGDFWVDVRVSIVPTRAGYSIACRLLDSRNAGRPLDSLYMPDQVRQAFGDAIASPEGLILCVGPTGQGKTTTLYAALAARNTPDSKIVTVEDPIEYALSGVEQVNVQAPDRTFVTVLKAFLRQDFDVALVGEIRDATTADIAVTAANTGHLVMSSMHASDTAAAIRLLIERYGVKSDGLAAAVRAIVAQRLLPKLCPDCSEFHHLDSAADTRIAELCPRVDRQLAFARLGTPERRSVCQTCDGRGTIGVVPVMELLCGEPSLLLAIERNEGIEEIAKRQPQFMTLREAALMMSANGLVDLEHALAVA